MCRSFTDPTSFSNLDIINELYSQDLFKLCIALGFIHRFRNCTEKLGQKGAEDAFQLSLKKSFTLSMYKNLNIRE